MNPSFANIASSSGGGAGRMIRIGPVANRLTNPDGSVGRAVVEYDCGRIGLELMASVIEIEADEWSVGRIV